VTGTPPREAGRTAGTAVWVPLVALWLVWGSTYLGIAVVGTSMPPLIGNATRFVVAAAILAVALVATRGPRALRITAAELRSTAVLGVALLSVGIGTLALAERYVPSGIAALIVAVIPLYIVLLRLSAGDRPAPLTLVGVAIGLGGLAVMLLPGGTAPAAGTELEVVLWSLAILGSAFCWAFFSWRSARYTFPRNPLVTTTYEMAIAGVVLVAAGLLRGERVDLAVIRPDAWWALGWLVAASLIGYTSYTWLLGHAPLSLTATYAYVNPVVAVVLGYLILREPLTSDVLIGLTVVVGGVALVVTGERRRGSRPIR
jgi:drug/metabolite transporter (DMT)-like permease